MNRPVRPCGNYFDDPLGFNDYVLKLEQYADQMDEEEVKREKSFQDYLNYARARRQQTKTLKED